MLHQSVNGGGVATQYDTVVTVAVVLPGPESIVADIGEAAVELTSHTRTAQPIAVGSDGNIHPYLAVTIDGIDYLLVSNGAGYRHGNLLEGRALAHSRYLQRPYSGETIIGVSETVVFYPAVIAEDKALSVGQHLAAVELERCNLTAVLIKGYRHLVVINAEQAVTLARHGYYIFLLYLANSEGLHLLHNKLATCHLKVVGSLHGRYIQKHLGIGIIFNGRNI